MLDKLAKVEARFEEIERQLSAADAAVDRDKFAGLTREHSELSELVAACRERRRIAEQLEETIALAADPDADIVASHAILAQHGWKALR